MHAIRRTIVLIGSLSLAAATLLAVGPAAFAQRHPLPEGRSGRYVPVVQQNPEPVAADHGSLPWIFLVVVTTIVVTLTVQLLIVKARPALRRRLAHA